MPARVQRTRPRVKGQLGMPPGSKYVGRGSKWGNPARLVREPHGFVIKWGKTGGSVGTWPIDGREARRYATELYRDWIGWPEQAELRALARQLLTGWDLACWCAVPEPGEPDHCHGAVLLDLAAKRPLSPFAASDQPIATPKESR